MRCIGLLGGIEASLPICWLLAVVSLAIGTSAPTPLDPPCGTVALPCGPTPMIVSAIMPPIKWRLDGV